MTIRTVIMITDTRVSVLQVSGDAVVFSAVQELTGPAPDPGAGLVGLARSKGFMRAGAEVWVVFPRKSVIMRQLVLPSRDPEELRRMVELQCAQQVPYAREDIALDFMALDGNAGGYPAGYTGVVLAAVLREQYQRVIQACAGAGVPLKHMTLSSWGLAQWCARFSVAAPEAASCVIDLQDAECEICVCGRGKVFTSRYLDWGFTQLAAGSIQGFIRQLEMTLANYTRQKSGPAALSIVVVSPEVRDESFCQELTQSFGLPVHWEAPAGKVQWKGKPAPGRDNAPRAALIGVALAREKGFDLIPDEIKLGAQERQRRSMAWRLALAGGLAFLALIAVFSVERVKGGLYVEALENESADLKVKAAKVEEKSGRIRLLAGLINDRLFVADVIAAIYQAIPPGMSLVSLSLSQGYSMVLQGVAIRNEDINIFQKALLASGWFGKVGLEFVNKRIEASGEVNFFKIVLQIKDGVVK
ncbi:MAG: pilus assembly protein PilM [Candidatus Omnitrophica bacterium]|nr:pilus assembly protein PilM [Candidatus Omnitrophota bacterium]